MDVRLGLFVSTILVSVFSMSLAFGGETSPDSAGYQYSQPIERTFSDLPYATQSPSQKLDLYLPVVKNGPAPLVIWIHGGGFRVGDKHSMPRRNFGPAPKPKGRDGPYQIQVPDVAALTREGYAVVSLNYRLLRRPGDRFVDFARPAVQDGKAAVRFLRANAALYGLDLGKFVVWGNSAGGFIAAMLAATGDDPTIFDDPTLGSTDVSGSVQAAVIWYGAIEVDDLSIAHYISAAKIIPNFDRQWRCRHQRSRSRSDPAQRRTAEEGGEIHPHDIVGCRS